MTYAQLTSMPRCRKKKQQAAFLVRCIFCCRGVFFCLIRLNTSKRVLFSAALKIILFSHANHAIRLLKNKSPTLHHNIPFEQEKILPSLPNQTAREREGEKKTSRVLCFFFFEV